MTEETILVYKIAQLHDRSHGSFYLHLAITDIVREYLEMPDTLERRKQLFNSLSMWTNMTNLEMIQTSELLNNYHDSRTVL